MIPGVMTQPPMIVLCSLVRSRGRRRQGQTAGRHTPTDQVALGRAEKGGLPSHGVGAGREGGAPRSVNPVRKGPMCQILVHVSRIPDGFDFMQGIRRYELNRYIDNYLFIYKID